MRAAVIRFQTLDGTWETVGVDRAAGIVPERVQYGSDAWGSSTASFDLRRPTGVQWPDIRAFTPVEIEVDGVLVWSGRVRETPMREGADGSVISVVAEGWQYHLDDDVYQRTYVHTRLSDWKDMRSIPTASLTGNTLIQAGMVSNDNGTITLGYGSGTEVITGAAVGVVLDLGPSGRAKRLVLQWEASNTYGDVFLFARGANTPDHSGWGTAQDFFSFNNTPATSGTTAGTVTTARRYVQIFAYYNGPGGAFLGGNQAWFKLKSIQVFSDTAYESGNASILKVSQVLPDVLLNATELLSSDTSRIATTSFSIPEFTVATPRTARDVATALNSYHDYILQVDVNKRLVFQPRPTDPALTIGATSNAEITDSSANSGQDIYNFAWVTGTGPDGLPVEVKRAYAAAVTGLPSTLKVAREVLPDGAYHANGDFEVDASGWAAYGGASVARSTAQQYTGVASLNWIPTGANGFTTQFSGTFRAGWVYTLSFWMRSDGIGSWGGYFGIGPAGFFDVEVVPGTTWTRFTYTLVPTVDTPGSDVYFQSQGNIAGQSFFVDNVQILVAQPTLVDRLGFQRTKVIPVEFGVTTTTAQQIADTFLRGHATTPYKGSVKIYEDAAIETTTGRPVGAHLLPLYTGQMLRMDHRVDPDTGGLGRDGRIAEVQYDLDSDSASVTLDNQRSNFEAYIARLAVVTGSAVQR